MPNAPLVILIPTRLRWHITPPTSGVISGLHTRSPPSPCPEAPPPVNQLISRARGTARLAPDADRGAVAGAAGERARVLGWPVASEG